MEDAKSWIEQRAQSLPGVSMSEIYHSEEVFKAIELAYLEGMASVTAWTGTHNLVFQDINYDDYEDIEARIKQILNEE